MPRSTVPDCCILWSQNKVKLQLTTQLKESQLVFFGLRDHLWLKGPVLGVRKPSP
jgi:hypothetical protein